LNKEASELLAGTEKNIGIAPFAMHLQKQYPIEKTKELRRKKQQKSWKRYRITYNLSSESSHSKRRYSSSATLNL